MLDMDQVQKLWRVGIKSLYPDICQTTYFVPPVYFNRVQYAPDGRQVAEKPVLVQRQPSKEGTKKHQSGGTSTSTNTDAAREVFESDVCEDVGQNHVLGCLQALFEKRKDVVFVISQLNYANYLNKLLTDTSTNLTKPKDLDSEHSRGDFDLLIVIKGFGIVVGEIKSIGLQPCSDLAALGKRIERAVKQLNKSEKVMCTMMKDIPNAHLAKTLILPYVKREQLLGILRTNDALKTGLCASLGVQDVRDAAELCLCADSLSRRDSRLDVTPDIISKLKDWFDLYLKLLGKPFMTDVDYENVVARLAGQVTTVQVHCPHSPRLEVRTLGEGVSETGERLSMIVLTQEQFQLLNKAQEMPMVCLVGPPGTGKSLMLVLVGLEWLRRGHDVIVLSTRPESFAISYLIKHQLEQTVFKDPTFSQPAPRVSFLHYDLRGAEGCKKADEAVQCMLPKAMDGALHVLMDEVWFTSKSAGPLLKEIIEKLRKHVPKLHLWAGTLRHINIPDCLRKEKLTVPLRCAPVIQHEVAEGLDERIDDYTSNEISAPCDGPKVITLLHQGGGHTAQWPIQCYTCGTMVAEELRKLRVGVQEDDAACASSVSDKDSQRPPPLKYSDVFVLTRSTELQDDVNYDADGNALQASSDGASRVCGFVRGLRDNPFEIPIRVIPAEIDDFKSVAKDLALSEKDRVVVADVEMAHGLERKVVVCLEGRKPGDEKTDDATMKKLGRLYAASRCQAQLIVVETPSSSSNK